MAGNADSGETVYLKAVRSTKLNGQRRSLGAVKKNASGPAAAPALDLKTFTKVTGDGRAQIKSVQHQIDILVERNIALQKELTELMQKEAQFRHLAYHDGLTGLSNRSLLQDRFHQAMSQANRRHKPLALLLLDLDEFKRVNDTLGHAGGDKLLQAVALRLTKIIRGGDTACRYGGDEFVIMLPEIDSTKIVTTLASKIAGRLSEPYIIDGHKVHMAASIGVAVYPGDGQTFDDLIKQADSAPVEGAHDLRLRRLSYKQPTHLAQLVEQLGFDLWPGLPRGWIAICLCFTAIQFSRQRVRHGRRRSRVKAVPKPADQLKALLRGQLINRNRA